MPTGYTYPVAEGKVTELKPFVLQCCRAMGACIMMRDDSFDAEIPEAFEPSDYHAKAIATAKRLLTELTQKTTSEQLKYGAKLKADAIRSLTSGRKAKQVENDRIAAIRNKVLAWEPPTSEHKGLKTFMLDQLAMDAGDTEFWDSQLAQTEDKTDAQFFRDALASAKRDIETTKKENREEIKRAKDRTEWMQAVRQSLS